MTARDGGPAFPAEIDLESYLCPSTRHEPGMTLRDYFAAKAMESALMPSPTGKTWPDKTMFTAIARFSYEMADAMLKAREEQP